MNFNLMRFFDLYAGMIALSLLRMVIPILDKIRHWGPQREVRGILIQKYLGIGSIINAIPLIEEIRRRYPGIPIYFLTSHEQKELIDYAGLCDEMILIDRSSFIRFLVSLPVAILSLQRRRIDVCFDLEFFSRFSMMMACVSGARIRVGFYSHFNIRSSLLTHCVSFNHYTQISRSYLAMIEAVGVKLEEENSKISLPSFSDDCADELTELLGDYGGEELIAVNASSSGLCSLRAWSALNYVRLLERLHEARPTAWFVLIGGSDDVDTVNFIESRVEVAGNRICNLAGRTSFKALMALMERADILITNDSGPAHVAAAYNTNEVVLFGPETPVIYRPVNENARVIYHPPFCSPCINVLDNKKFQDCALPECMMAITVDEVFNATVGLLDRETRRTEKSPTVASNMRLV